MLVTLRITFSHNKGRKLNKVRLMVGARSTPGALQERFWSYPRLSPGYLATLLTTETEQYLRTVVLAVVFHKVYLMLDIPTIY